MPETRFLTNRMIYENVVLRLVPSARNRLWIATADIKDMYVEKPGQKAMVPFLLVLSELLERGVDWQIRRIVKKNPALFDVYCQNLTTL